MRAFFAKVRKSDFMNADYMKYTSYAVGETLLVVVGILIAVQVNNWNQERQASNAETVLLENVIESLREDLVFMEQVQNEFAAIDDLHYQIYLYLEGALPADSIQNIQYVRRTILYNPVTMITHPDLANEVLDPELKKVVRQYYQYMDDTYYLIDDFNAFIEDVLRAALGELEVLNFGVQFSEDFDNIMVSDDIILKEEFLDALEDPFLQQVLFEAGVKYEVSTLILSNLQQQNKAMIEAIEEYLSD